MDGYDAGCWPRRIRWIVEMWAQAFIKGRGRRQQARSPGGNVVSGEMTSADRVKDRTGISGLNCAPDLRFGCWEILSFLKGEKCGLLDMA
jgi:hypothetical protein